MFFVTDSTSKAVCFLLLLHFRYWVNNGEFVIKVPIGYVHSVYSVLSLSLLQMWYVLHFVLQVSSAMQLFRTLYRQRAMCNVRVQWFVLHVQCNCTQYMQYNKSALHSLFSQVQLLCTNAAVFCTPFTKCRPSLSFNVIKGTLHNQQKNFQGVKGFAIL